MKVIRDVFLIPQLPFFFQEIFQFLNLNQQVYDAENLATDYFLGYSGAKYVSPLLINLMNGASSVDSTISHKIFLILRSRFGENWRRLYATTTADYNPIHNYDMSEQEHRELSGTDDNINTKNLTNKTDHGMSNTSDDYIYGFNSSNEQPSNKYVSQDGGTTTVTNSGTDNDSRTNTENEDITRTRSGNIGVTTTQAMLQQERELWSWNFVEQIYKDIDSILTLRVYDACKV